MPSALPVVVVVVCSIVLLYVLAALPVLWSKRIAGKVLRRRRYVPTCPIARHFASDASRTLRTRSLARLPGR